MVYNICVTIVIHWMLAIYCMGMSLDDALGYEMFQHLMRPDVRTSKEEENAIRKHQGIEA